MMIIVLLINFTYIIMVQIKKKNQYLNRKHEENGFKNLRDTKNFTEYSNNMQDVYKNIE